MLIKSNQLTLASEVPITQAVADFFPTANQDSWRFVEENSHDAFTFAVSVRTEGERRVFALDAPQETRLKSFFDRMTVTPSGLELNRIHFTNAIFDIRPPFVLTLGPEVNQVAALFPPQPVPGLPPYGACTISKQLAPVPGSNPPATRWEVAIECTGKDGTKLLRAKLAFETGRGLTQYIGDFYGGFFIYKRQS